LNCLTKPRQLNRWVASDFMTRHRPSRLVGVFLLGMVLVIVISALTRSNLPLFIWFLAFCVTMLVAIGQEWFIVNKPFRSRRTRLQITRLLVGSYPYVAAIVFMATLTYCALKLLAGYTIGPYEARIMGKIAFFTVGSVFVGTYFLFAVIFVINLIRRR